MDRGGGVHTIGIYIEMFYFAKLFSYYSNVHIYDTANIYDTAIQKNSELKQRHPLCDSSNSSRFHKLVHMEIDLTGALNSYSH